ncbi:hypothetical protein J4221_04545 [Candidatus Pacearchaeota archaeon]|nr:hypothetical protein [Candidatus Pacearchaeota archaeon]
MKTRKNIRKNKEDNNIVWGVSGFGISLIGLLLAFNFGTDNIYLFILFVIMIAGGIILVAKSLSK